MPELPSVPKLSLKERILGTKSAAPEPAKKAPTRRGAKKQESTELFAKAMPTILAGMIANYSSKLLPEEYRACAPAQQEVMAMIGPIFAIMSRSVEVTGKISQTQLDLATALLCTITYGMRAHMTYLDIKREREQPGYAERKRREYLESLDREARSYQDTVTGTPGDRNGEMGAVGRSEHAGDGGSNDSGNANGNTTSEADIIANMFARDKQGRVRLGLLAG